MCWFKHAIIISFTIISQSIPFCFCKFETFESAAIKGSLKLAFRDPELRKTNFKANLICNACNGILVGNEAPCAGPNCTSPDHKSPGQFVWQSAFFSQGSILG